MGLSTRGFFGPTQLCGHFQEHGADFGCKTAQQYEALADAFLTDPLLPTVKQCVRAQGDICRFDIISQAFGVLSGSGVIRTFYKPIPCASVADPVVRAALKASGRCHQEATNLVYF